jgi:TonB family protein
MKTLKRLSAVGALLLAVTYSLAPLPCHAQDNTGKRRVVEHMAPAYPTLARNLALEGTVKVDALVAPDGTVKTVEIKAGHPILVQAAANAVRRWRWEPAPHDSHELVEVKFSPE